jgi:hypothetical protein
VVLGFVGCCLASVGWRCVEIRCRVSCLLAFSDGLVGFVDGCLLSVKWL